MTAASPLLNSARLTLVVGRRVLLQWCDIRWPAHPVQADGAAAGILSNEEWRTQDMPSITVSKVRHSSLSNANRPRLLYRLHAPPYR